MFSDQRKLLDQNTREPFAKKNPAHKEDLGPPSGVYVSNAQESRELILERFPNNVSKNVILNYDSIDQNDTCACSFVGYLNMIRIYDAMHNTNLLPHNIKSKWKGIWNSFNVCSATDIAMTLDKMATNKQFAQAIQLTNYVPIRSAGVSERAFNKSFWVDKSVIVNRYEYAEMMHTRSATLWDEWLFQIAYLIESKIDSGIPVEINSQSHSRTCVAYNDNDLLFADNYGNDYAVDYTEMEKCRLGFCSVNKWLVYSTVRDLCYLSPPSLQQVGKPSSSTTPSKHKSKSDCMSWVNNNIMKAQKECMSLKQKNSSMNCSFKKLAEALCSYY